MQPIISYAGLEESALWESAKRMFALADDYVPERFRSFLPLFPAELCVTLPPSGNFSLSDAYHRQLYQRMPALYAFDNLKRLLDANGAFLPNAVITVDRVWTAQFPQYLPYVYFDFSVDTHSTIFGRKHYVVLTSPCCVV